jgi:hypothetical protein
VNPGIALAMVWLVLVLVLPIVLLTWRLWRGDQIEPTSEGKQFFGRRGQKKGGAADGPST